MQVVDDVLVAVHLAGAGPAEQCQHDARVDALDQEKDGRGVPGVVEAVVADVVRRQQPLPGLVVV